MFSENAEILKSARHSLICCLIACVSAPNCSRPQVTCRALASVCFSEGAWSLAMCGLGYLPSSPELQAG